MDPGGLYPMIERATIEIVPRTLQQRLDEVLPGVVAAQAKKWNTGVQVSATTIGYDNDSLPCETSLVGCMWFHM